MPRAEAEARRGFDPDGAMPEDRARTAPLYFGDLLQAHARTFKKSLQQCPPSSTDLGKRITDTPGSLKCALAKHVDQGTGFEKGGDGFLR